MMTDSLIRLLAKVLIRFHLLKKMIIVRVDGGICSQMHFFLIGQQLKEKGFLVKYDLDWFKNNGKDLTGKFARNFDLLKAFPDLDVCVAKKYEIFFYSRLAYSSSAYQIAKAPTYMEGYYANDQSMYRKDFHRFFKFRKSVLDSENNKLFNEILTKSNTVAIHVRRGDLAVTNGAYGAPVNTDYFIKVLHKIQEEKGRLNCYIFSDEPEWVKNNMIQELPCENSYYLVDINGSDRGYMDMFLISACKYQVTSKGSLGKFGGFLNRDVNGRIYVFDDEIERKNWDNVHDKIEFIS